MNEPMPKITSLDQMQESILPFVSSLKLTPDGRVEDMTSPQLRRLSQILVQLGSIDVDYDHAPPYVQSLLQQNNNDYLQMEMDLETSSQMEAQIREKFLGDLVRWIKCLFKDCPAEDARLDHESAEKKRHEREEEDKRRQKEQNETAEKEAVQEREQEEQDRRSEEEKDRQQKERWEREDKEREEKERAEQEQEQQQKQKENTNTTEEKINRLDQRLKKEISDFQASVAEKSQKAAEPQKKEIVNKTKVQNSHQVQAVSVIHTESHIEKNQSLSSNTSLINQNQTFNNQNQTRESKSHNKNISDVKVQQLNSTEKKENVTSNATTNKTIEKSVKAEKYTITTEELQKVLPQGQAQKVNVTNASQEASKSASQQKTEQHEKLFESIEQKVQEKIVQMQKTKLKVILQEETLKKLQKEIDQQKKQQEEVKHQQELKRQEEAKKMEDLKQKEAKAKDELKKNEEKKQEEAKHLAEQKHQEEMKHLEDIKHQYEARHQEELKSKQNKTVSTPDNKNKDAGKPKQSIKSMVNQFLEQDKVQKKLEKMLNEELTTSGQNYTLPVVKNNQTTAQKNISANANATQVGKRASISSVIAKSAMVKQDQVDSLASQSNEDIIKSLENENFYGANDESKLQQRQAEQSSERLQNKIDNELKIEKMEKKMDKMMRMLERQKGKIKNLKHQVQVEDPDQQSDPSKPATSESDGLPEISRIDDVPDAITMGHLTRDVM